MDFNSTRSSNKVLKGMSGFGNLKGMSSLNLNFGTPIRLPLLKTHDFNAMVEPLSRITRVLRPVGEAFAKVGQKIERERKFSELALAQGVIPHRVYLSVSDCEFSQTDNLWGEHISKNVVNITEELSSSYPGGDIKAARSDVFEQIVSAFNNGSYFLVCRSCAIEIEGLASDIFTQKGSWKYKEWQKFVTERAVDFAGEIPLSHNFFMLEYEVIRDFSKKVFETKKFDQIHQEEKFDFLFNRHFHAHGYLFEANRLDALNSLALLHNFAVFFSFIGDLESRLQS